MRTRTTVAVVAIGLCTCELAYSAPAPAPSNVESQAPITGPYLGVDGGVWWLSESVDGASATVSAGTLRAFAGYQFNRFVAVEAGYRYLFSLHVSASGGDFSTEEYAFDGCLLGTLPMSPDTGLFARAGAVNWHETASGSLGNLSGSFSDHGTKPLYGVGGYVTRDRITARLEFLHARIQTADVNALTVAVTYAFGASQPVSYKASSRPQPATSTQAPEAPPPAVAGREVVVSRNLRAWFGPAGQGGQLVVTAVEKDGPAGRAGIKVGDVITAIDGQPTAPYLWSNAAARITGGAGDTVRLVVLSK